MGAVYRAYDERLRRRVALKQIRADTVQTPVTRERFLREAQAAAGLSHPAIVQIHDFLEAGGTDWIVMELIQGQTLARLLREGPLDPGPATAIALDVCEGLVAAHDAGIIHRDLKTENVAVSTAGRAKILDFGLAKQLRFDGTEYSSLSLEGQVLGTPRAMSPEQAQGYTVDHRSDLFSLGVLMYETSTGTTPFNGSTPFEIVTKICTHSQVPARQVAAGLPREISDLIDSLLEKDPLHRPQKTREVAVSLRGIAHRHSTAEGVAELADSVTSLTVEHELSIYSDDTIEYSASAAEGGEPLPRLRFWPAPQLPERPFPLLLPYSHPKLLAGRDRELVQLRRRLKRPIPILGLHGPSGAGKSSLLAGGLTPSLRQEGVPVAFDRYPHEPGLAGRLLRDLEDRRGFEDPDWLAEPGCFLERLLAIHRVSGETSILVLDQLEDLLLRPEASSARTHLGILLAVTSQRQPGLGAPPCRWILAYRQELHGDVVAWLADVLYDAQNEYPSVAAALPSDLSGAERFHDWPLLPLGTPSPGSPATNEAARVFESAITTPLKLKHLDGQPVYPWRFVEDGARRLAQTFAEARISEPEAPLTPELQVVLAYLLSQAASDPDAQSDDGTIPVRVPDDPEKLLERALEDHLRRSLEKAFPASRHGAQEGRARALLALRELAAKPTQRSEGLPAEALIRAIGPGGAEVLENLASPLTRLVVMRRSAGGWHYALSHDRLAEVVVRVVETEGRQNRWIVDEELLSLRRFVALNSALHRSGESQSTRLTSRQYDRIETHGKALLWDDERRAWWAECQVQRRLTRRRWLWRSALLAVVLVLVAFAAWQQAQRGAEHQALLQEIARGEPEAALRTLDRLASEPRADLDELRARLAQRERPQDLFEVGVGGLTADRQSAAVLEAAALALPLFEDADEDLSFLAPVIWALDFLTRKDAELADRAKDLRDRWLAPLRQRHPPPAFDPEDASWAAIPAGSFLIGTGPDDERQEWDHANEQPQHRATLDAFYIGVHEVSNADFRRLFPDHPGEDSLPAVDVSWYEAYAYAAWLGGRLPTEPEWEYAARAGCRYEFCSQEGAEATRDSVCWYRRTAVDPTTFEVSPRPIMQLHANPWGLYDTCGNVWEWTADWFAPYPAEGRRGDSPPSRGDLRVMRGGSFWDDAYMARHQYRLLRAPDIEFMNSGFRVMMPMGSRSPP